MFNAPFFAGLFFFVLSNYLLLRKIKDRSLIVQCETWPQAPGKMLHSKATQYNSTSKRWDFNAEYEYTVEGKTYRNYIATFYTITHQEEAESLARDFPLDKEIRVFYNPSNPKQSVLKRGNSNRSKNGEVIFASLGVIFGIGIMIAGYLDVFSN